MNDHDNRRLTEVAEQLIQLFGDVPFVIAALPRENSSIATVSSLPPAGQIALLEAVLTSFRSDRAEPFEVLRLQKEPLR